VLGGACLLRLPLLGRERLPPLTMLTAGGIIMLGLSEVLGFDVIPSSAA
jgi:hypothetical protein